MSKSLGNTVSPEEMIELYGADTVRLFILFAANPTAGMDWSDTALDANHRVMVQMRSMPDQITSWKVRPSPMDDWLDARMTQRIHEFCTAMDDYDLRRAVEISHYDIIKDINWYTRRGGENLDVAHRQQYNTRHPILRRSLVQSNLGQHASKKRVAASRPRLLLKFV